jgi:hypothetical protein
MILTIQQFLPRLSTWGWFSAFQVEGWRLTAWMIFHGRNTRGVVWEEFLVMTESAIAVFLSLFCAVHSGGWDARHAGKVDGRWDQSRLRQPLSPPPAMKSSPRDHKEHAAQESTSMVEKLASKVFRHVRLQRCCRKLELRWADLNTCFQNARQVFASTSPVVGRSSFLCRT